MRGLLGTVAVSSLLVMSGAAWACDGHASHDDAIAQMTKPQPSASVLKKAPDVQRLTQRGEKRASVPKQQVATLKTAAPPAE
jgi:hypothetical protein